eukprot:209693-Ditylum_brightwellii.AAC.1
MHSRYGGCSRSRFCQVCQTVIPTKFSKAILAQIKLLLQGQGQDRATLDKHAKLERQAPWPRERKTSPALLLLPCRGSRSGGGCSVSATGWSGTWRWM